MIDKLISSLLTLFRFHMCIHLLHCVFSHLEKPGSTVRTLFFDFSNAFNTIQLDIPTEKLEMFGVDYNLADWILDYLTDSPQFVRVCETVCLESGPAV